MSPPYTFQPVTQGDLPQLEVWLQGPEVVTWWGDPVEQAELLRSDIDEPRMQMELVLFNGKPFAYVQSYEVHAWPQPHLDHLPIGSRANRRAVRAYYNAGFRVDTTFSSEEGPGVVMLFKG